MNNFLVLKAFDIDIHPRPPLRCIEVYWSPTPMGWIKCNIDRLAKGSPMKSSCGVIFRNDSVGHMGSFCAYLNEGNFVLAEFLAVVIAVEKTMERNWTNLWIETNCILVVNVFTNTNLVSWYIKSRWLDCCAYTLLMDFKITHTFREANFCADFLPNLGFQTKTFTWFDRLHFGLLKDFLLDKLDFPRSRLCN